MTADMGEPTDWWDVYLQTTVLADLLAELSLQGIHTFGVTSCFVSSPATLVTWRHSHKIS